MTVFVHLTMESQVPRIKRNGLTVTRFAKDATPDSGLFAMPVMPNFYDSHQWLRELARRPGARLCAVYFRLGDREPVHVGRFAGLHVEMTAAEAVAEITRQDRSGMEVIVPRRIPVKDIVRIKALPQTIGWRYYPEAKGREPLWPRRGAFGAARYRNKIEAREADEAARYFSRFPAEWYVSEE